MVGHPTTRGTYNNVEKTSPSLQFLLKNGHVNFHQKYIVEEGFHHFGLVRSFLDIDMLFYIHF